MSMINSPRFVFRVLLRQDRLIGPRIALKTSPERQQPTCRSLGYRIVPLHPDLLAFRITFRKLASMGITFSKL